VKVATDYISVFTCVVLAWNNTSKPGLCFAFVAVLHVKERNG